MTEVTPYEKLACIYDQLMDHVDYKNWALYILKLVDHLGLDIQSVIDLSCGTGTFLSHFKNSIGKSYGCDQSISMITQAKQKHTQASLFTNDIRIMALKDKTVDCALLLYDSLNYITNKDDLNSTLKEVHRILLPGGLFVFDIVSESHCKEYYADYHESEYWNDRGYTRHSYFNQKEGLQINEFRIVLNGRTYFEKHLQRVYSFEYLNKVLAEHSFEIVNIFNEFSLDNVDNESGRMHFVCMSR